MATATQVKHTPGPWTDISDRANARHPMALISTNCLDSISIDATKSGRTFDESRANARLIAAAPEMLDALRTIESCLAPEDNDFAAKKVRYAISLAEGR